MKKKVALMTWHHAENYGTAFQAYALKLLIEQHGFEVNLVDYHRLRAPIKLRTLKEISTGFVRRLFQKFKWNKEIFFKFRDDTFNTFYENYFDYTQPCVYNQDFLDLNTEYVGFVCGSDQIWNPELFDARYFLDFVIDKKRLIAYAPSLGVSEFVGQGMKQFMGPLINRFTHLSVREQTGCEIVKELSGRRDVLNVLDPVLMINAELWDQITEDITLPDGEYMFIFFLINNDNYIKEAIKQAEEKRLKAVVLHCTQSEDTRFANIDELTPGQLLTYISHASYVCTDSFHIIVLSIIYSIPFKAFKKYLSDSGMSQNSRITDLLKRLSIVDAEFCAGCTFEANIDYCIVQNKLQEQRMLSFDYLRNALQSLPVLETTNFALLCTCTSPCQGELSSAFQERMSTESNSRYMKVMRKYPFTLAEKCYRCKYLDNQKEEDSRMPLFYYDLEKALKNENNISKIYRKYYFPFHAVSCVKKLLLVNR